MTTEITVRGTYGSSEPPERATVHASIGYEGPSIEPVYARVVRDLEIVQASVAALKNGANAPITWWSAERLRTWSNRPWNQDGKQLPLVHHAGVNIEVKFRDFAALSSWVGEHITGTEGFQVGTISWALTAKRRDELVRQVRTRAVRDAVERAQLYADALGLGSVTPIAIADAGMLAADLHPADGTGRAYTVGRAAMSADQRSDIELVPQDIEVTASVDARFLVEVPRPSNSIVGADDPDLSPAPEAPYDIHGPAPDDAAVEAWADDYIPFEKLSSWQRELRTDIRRRCRQLRPSDDEVLHASFFGAKHPRADIENLLLYNIDSFKDSGKNGIRFEHGVRPTNGHVDYRFGYRYALAPRSGTFDHWQRGRTLASFDRIDLGAFAGEKKLAQVWLALWRGEVQILESAEAGTNFGVRVQVQPPAGREPVWGGLLKGIFDGVICALQNHTDTSMLSEVAERLATVLPADPAEIEEHLLNPRRAVLGPVSRLVAPYGSGVKWDPSDHLCMAGELLAAEPSLPRLGDRWAIRGEVFELLRSPTDR